MKENTKYIKIGLVLVVSFIVIKFFTPHLFIADSPKINHEFIARIMDMPSNIASITRLLNNESQNDNNLAPKQIISQQQIDKAYADLSFSEIAKGVQAAEDPTSKVIYFKANEEMKFIKSQMVLPDGKTITIYKLQK